MGPPPVLSSLWGNNSTITMNFSEEMDAFFATDPANYTVNQDGGGSIAVTGAVLSGDGKTVTLTLASAARDRRLLHGDHEPPRQCRRATARQRHDGPVPDLGQ